jgi:hypothetical protein
METTAAEPTARRDKHYKLKVVVSGYHFDEKFTTKLPMDRWLSTAALERADRKFVGLQTLLTCRSNGT